MMLACLLALAAAPAEGAQYLPYVYQRGDAVATIQLYAPLLQEPATVTSIEAALAELKLPNLKSIVLESRLAIARQSLVTRVAHPDFRELELLVEPLVSHFRDEYQAIRQHPLLRAGRPAPPIDYRDLFWDHYTLENRIAQLGQEAAYFSQIARRFPRAQSSKLSEVAARHLQGTLADDLVAAIDKAAIARREREMEARLDRLSDSAARLAQTPLNPSRVTAAGTWRIDQHKLVEYLKQAQPERRVLREPQLLKKVVALGAESERRAGELTSRAELLLEALFWWSRGRYGVGSHERGLAKHPLAFRDNTLQMQVMMPTRRPQANNPQDPEDKQLVANGDTPPEPSVPHVDRRNHYWWVVGQRDIQEQSWQSERSFIQTVPVVKTMFM